MLRSDFMQEKTSSGDCIKQVEMNTIASGFGWLGIVSGDIHRSGLKSPNFLYIWTQTFSFNISDLCLCLKSVRFPSR